MAYQYISTFRCPQQMGLHSAHTITYFLVFYTKNQSCNKMVTNQQILIYSDTFEFHCHWIKVWLHRHLTTVKVVKSFNNADLQVTASGFFYILRNNVYFSVLFTGLEKITKRAQKKKPVGTFKLLCNYQLIALVWKVFYWLMHFFF